MDAAEGNESLDAAVDEDAIDGDAPDLTPPTLQVKALPDLDAAIMLLEEDDDAEEDAEEEDDDEIVEDVENVDSDEGDEDEDAFGKMREDADLFNVDAGKVDAGEERLCNADADTADDGKIEAETGISAAAEAPPPEVGCF